jgi:hypothetical protein
LSSTQDGPYVGLSSFSAAQSQYFFGRVIASRIASNNVITRPITVLYGASGVGKSSVLKAGLPAMLKTRFAGTAFELRDEWHDLPARMAWLGQAADNAQRTRPNAHILILDQFEEYFLYPAGEFGGAFESALADLTCASDSNIRLLFSLRDDGLHKLDQLRFWLPGILDNTIALDHLDDGGVRDAIERPVEVYNQEQAGRSPPLVLGKGFTDEIIKCMHKAQEVSGQQSAVALPYLQLVLQRLWVGRHAGPEQMTIDIQLLDDLGGVDGIVRAHLEDQLNELTEGERQLASVVFHYLVTPSGGKFAYLPEDLAKLAFETTGYAIETEDVRRLLQALADGDTGANDVGSTQRARKPHAGWVLRETGKKFELFHDVLARPILDWRASYIERAPFAYLTDVYTGEEVGLTGHGYLFGRFGKDFEGKTPMAGRPISRNHVLILGDGQVLDLRSRFGTTINARPLHFGETGMFLHSGDIVGFANSAAMVYRSVRDYLPFVPGETASEPHWGLLIDGEARLIRQLSEPSLYLGIDVNEWLTAGPRKPSRGGFAYLQRDEVGRVQITALEGGPSLQVIEREDSYYDREWVLKKDASYHIQLRSIKRPKLKTIADVEGAERGVFRVGKRYFEIIVY